MKIAFISLEVPDDFTPGECLKCPCYLDVYDEFGASVMECCAVYKKADCPIELNE